MADEEAGRGGVGDARTPPAAPADPPAVPTLNYRKGDVAPPAPTGIPDTAWQFDPVTKVIGGLLATLLAVILICGCLYGLLQSLCGMAVT